MKILIPILIVSALLLSGCDAVSDTIQKALDKGDLDGVVRCMESNANKEEFLSSDYIKKECIKKYTLH